MTPSPALEIEALRVRFPLLSRTVEAVSDIDLRLNQGEILGLVGESGCGKSMTAAACLGLVAPPGVVTGSVLVGSKQIVGRAEHELDRIRGEQIAMIFQNPMAALNPFFTIGRQITDVIRRHRDASARESRQIAAAALEQVRIPDASGQLLKYPHQLSGGQLQRVMIAMALACRPRVLIADEPTTALDVTVQAQILLLLQQLVDETGMAVLFITHDLSVVSALCERVAIMYAGRLIEQGEVADVFARPGHPYTQGLLNTVPTLGARHKQLQAIPGNVPDLSTLSRGCAFQPRCRYATERCLDQTPSIQARGAQARTGVACHHPLTPSARLMESET